MNQNISSMSTADLISSLSTGAEEARSETAQEKPIGKYGKMAMSYMEKTNPSRLNLLVMENRHRALFREVDNRAWQRMEKITAQLQRQRPRPTAGSYMELAQYDNQIRSAAEEIVLTEIVYQDR